MAKKTVEKGINLDNILFKCRDILRAARNSGSFFEKRDMMLTLVFLRFIGEKYEDGIEKLRQTLVQQGLDPDDENIRAAFFDDATFTDGTYNLPPEARWSTIINTTAPKLNVALDTALHSIATNSSQLKGCFMPCIAMVASVGSNDKKDMYDYLGGTRNDKRSEELDVLFKKEKSNFRIVIVVDMWITGFDVPSLTYLYNDKPLKKHLLIQTISRVNRKYPDKDYGMIIDYIGIRDNMREAMKIYGGDSSVAPNADDVEQATKIFRENLEILKSLFGDYDLSPFLNPQCDPAMRYRLLAKAAEFVFVSTQELKTEGRNGSKKVSFKTYFLKTVKRMRTAFDVCQPSGELGEEESALAQCFMAIAGFVRKMSGTSEVDTETMNIVVSKMVEEALKYNQVESILESSEEEDIFSPEYFEKLSDVKMPATKLELLVKMLRKQIKEYGKVNQVASKTFQELLEKTLEEYNERRKHLSEEEAGETQEKASEDIIKTATEQALSILSQMNESRESFRKIGLTFEEKAFYDILIALRNEHNFEYGTDKEVDGVVINDKCKSLAQKVKEIIDTKSSFADWLNNRNVRNQLKLDIKIV